MGQDQSWGRLFKAAQELRPFGWSSDPLPGNASSWLPFGLGRSYGDSCINDGGALLLTTAMNRLLAFNPATGLMRCEAGASLGDILQFSVPRGWFLPTTPGTKFVTVGGAIANDVHGKNHHRAGSFGCHVTRFELLRSDGQRLLCSRETNPDWFAATIGGLGLTGLITWAEFHLRKVASSMIDLESIKFRNLEEFFELSAQSDAGFEHTVAWVDCLAKGSALGRGIFMRGNHSASGSLVVHRGPLVSVPCELPGALLSPFAMRAFNTVYYERLRRRVTKATTHYDPFFYPLDAVHHWNRIYGRAGFFQYQFVVPGDRVAIRKVFTRIAASGEGSFLAVLKTFGPVPSPGMLSFPTPGITLAIDFRNRGEKTLELFADLDAIVLETGGRLYPAKDARMSAASFQQGYPEWERFRGFIDPAVSSNFWRRVSAQLGREA